MKDFLFWQEDLLVFVMDWNRLKLVIIQCFVFLLHQQREPFMGHSDILVRFICRMFLTGVTNLLTCCSLILMVLICSTVKKLQYYMSFTQTADRQQVPLTSMISCAILLWSGVSDWQWVQNISIVCCCAPFNTPPIARENGHSEHTGLHAKQTSSQSL